MEKQEPQSIQPQIPVQPAPQPVSGQKIEAKKPSPKLKLTALIILLLLILTIPFGGYLMLGRLGIHPKPSTVTIKTTATPTPAPDPTVSWKTYTRNFVNFGFSIKYPSDFYFAQGGGDGGVDYIGDSKNTVDNTYLAGKPLQNNQIVVSFVALAESYSDMQKLANRIAGGTPQNVPYVTENVGGTQAIKVIYNNTVNYALTANDQNFVWISAQPANSEQITTFWQMIKTFKFTDQTSQSDETATWKTYVDPDGIYSLKYPPTWTSKTSKSSSDKSVDLMSDERPLFHIYVSVIEGFGNYTAKQYVTNYYTENKDADGNELDPGLKYLSIEEKTINGNNVSIIKGLQSIPGRREPAAWLTHGNVGIYVQTSSLSNPEEKDQAKLEQILSTFKFTQ